MKFLIVMICCLFAVGCSVNFTKAGGKADHRSAAVYLKKQAKVLVAPPTMEESFAKKLPLINWTAEKFCGELHREITYQLGKKGVKVIPDSNQVQSFITIHKYDPGNVSSPSKLEAYAVLKTEKGQRRIEVPVRDKKRTLFENEAQVIDTIRYLAAILASKMATQPRKRKDEPVYEPQMWRFFRNRGIEGQRSEIRGQGSASFAEALEAGGVRREDMFKPVVPAAAGMTGLGYDRLLD